MMIRGLPELLNITASRNKIGGGDGRRESTKWFCFSEGSVCPVGKDRTPVFGVHP
jgi:hypothetical protein